MTKKNKKEDCPSPISDDWNDLTEDKKKDCLKDHKLSYNSSFMGYNFISWMFYISIWVFGYALIEYVYAALYSSFSDNITWFWVITTGIVIILIMSSFYIDRRKNRFQQIIES